ncbi:transposase [Haloferula sargassicola]|uniref:Transposase IS200-like domain-containing protein n=1 Tax=Haloferula sargassicola TaxID=490096 RepID=A0ABP9USN5_9BACT
MARKPRYQAAGAIYHVMARGEGGKDVFEEDVDRKVWLERLGEACGRFGWRVHAWVQMGNHFHLLLETPEPNLVAGMKWFMGVYSQWWNIRRKRRGHVFQGRYKAVVVSGEGKGRYIRIVADYIHLNPVRSGWVGGTTGRKVVGWRWSSLPQYAGRKGCAWVETGRVLRAFELEEGGRGRRSYVGYIEKRGKDRAGTLSDESLKELRRGWCLGEPEFRDRVIEGLGAAIRRARGKGSVAGSEVRAHDEAEAERMVKQALGRLGVEDSESGLAGWGRLTTEKALVAYLVRTRTGVSNAWVAERLSMGHPGGVSRAVRKMKESRSLIRRAEGLLMEK